MQKTKYIIVVGGVISGVGKGIATASIGKILQSYGYKVSAIKIDPYINLDAGTMRPTEHGEVWVTSDGGEIDQDLGNYERFLGIELSKKNNITTGQIYHSIIEKERNGEFLGQTVQFIPHVPAEILRRVDECSKGYNIMLIEIGGTVGDYENEPFLLAMKRLEHKLGKKNVAYILVSYLPVPFHITEMKTKPTQQCIHSLQTMGIIPDMILCRANRPLDDVRRSKIETYANIRTDYVISAPDSDNLYGIPLNFEKENLGRKLLNILGLESDTLMKKIGLRKDSLAEYKELVNAINNPTRTIRIAMVCKYIDVGDFNLEDSYISVNESLKHAAAHFALKVKIEWINSKVLEKDGCEILKQFDGILVPGGFGTTGTEGKISAIKFARENSIPFLGLCFGLQLAVVEYARNVCGFEGANSTEINPDTKYPVITILESQKTTMLKSRYGATMRLGSYGAVVKENSKVYQLYKKLGRIEIDSKKREVLAKDPLNKERLGIVNKGDIVIFERHRHRYEVNPEYSKQIAEKGLIFSGMHRLASGTNLMEFIELADHPFFVATQAHPEFKSRLEKPNPLFYGFIEAIVKICKEKEEAVEK